MKHLLTLVAAGIAACIATASPAAAAVSTCATAPFYADYQYTLTYTVRAIWKYNGYADGCGSSAENSSTQGVGVTVDNGVFAQNKVIVRELQLGIASGLLGGDEGEQHLVIFTGTGFGANAIGRSFDSLFPNSNEADLIAALRVLAKDPFVEGDPDALSQFAEGDARNGAFGDAAFALGDPFAGIGFSDGQSIGTGISSARPAPAAPLPEPGSWALMIVGFGWLGASLRWRQSGVRATRHLPPLFAARASLAR